MKFAPEKFAATSIISEGCERIDNLETAGDAPEIGLNSPKRDQKLRRHAEFLADSR